jgi:hypothetical protein
MAAPHTANDEQVIANGLAQAMGKTGAPRIYNYGSPDPQFPIAAIYCVQDCLFLELNVNVDENSSVISAGSNQPLPVFISGGTSEIYTFIIPAGTIIRGNIHSFLLDSGVIIAYPA